MPIGPILRAMKHNRTRFALIILEIAITLAIVTNCVNMILVERKNMSRKSGFDDENLLSIRFAPFAPEFKEQTYTDAVVQADMRAIEGMPGVKAATVTYMMPWEGGGSSGTMTAEGYGEKFQAQTYPVTPRFIETLGTKLVAGRTFRPEDTPTDPNTTPSVAIISEALAKKLWGNENPIGKVIMSNERTNPRTVIGVIGDFYNPYAWNIGEYVRFSPAKWWDGGGATYLIRTEPGAMKSVVSQLEPRLVKINGGRTFRLQTISEVKDQFFQNSRLVITAMTAVIFVLVFVTALGILGITSLAVSERTKQIGTRRALGATRGDILTQFLTENWIVTSIGLFLGIIATYVLNFALVSTLTEAKMPWYLVGVGMVLLWINGLVATIPPALRAAKVAPAVATRTV
jgi:putative ABC transport system permease protein